MELGSNPLVATDKIKVGIDSNCFCQVILLGIFFLSTFFANSNPAKPPADYY